MDEMGEILIKNDDEKSPNVAAATARDNSKKQSPAMEGDYNV